MKPGIKTTEFWLGLITAILAYLNQTGVIGVALPPDILMAILSPVLLYIGGKITGKAVVARTDIKAQAEVAKAMVQAETPPADVAPVPEPRPLS